VLRRIDQQLVHKVSAYLDTSKLRKMTGRSAIADVNGLPRVSFTAEGDECNTVEEDIDHCQQLSTQEALLK
jgi:hypothetical protein